MKYIKIKLYLLLIMIRRVLTLVLLTLFVAKACFGKLDNQNLKVSDAKLNEISKNIRCLVCQNQSIVNSNSEFAIDIKKMIREKLADGKNKHEIFKFLKSKYGDYVLFDPPFQSNTFMLWILPFLFLFLGTSFLAIKYIKFRKK